MLWISGIVILLLITMISLPFIFKGKILEKIKTGINENLNAKVNFEDYDLTLFSSFPDFTLSLEKLVVTGVNEFNGDTLVYLKELKAGANLMSIIRGGTIQINKIILEEPYINLVVLKDGKANWDITKPSAAAVPGAESQTHFKMSLKKYELNKGLVRYVDQSSGMKSEIVNLNHTGKGDFTEDIFILATNTSMDALDFWYGGIHYLNRTVTKLKADVEMNLPEAKYTLKENELSLNDLTLDFDGWLSMPGDDINMDIKFNTKKTEFRNFISLIPGIYTDAFKDLKSSGKLTLDGFVKGKYNDKSMPGFGLNVMIQNGMFQYPSLPAAVSNVQMDMKILNPDGVPDHTNIDMNRLHVEIAGEPFDARLSVRTPVSDANLDAMVKGNLNLANISKIVPMEKGSDLNGHLDVDLTAKGRMSAIEQKNYEAFNAAGHLVLTGMKYVSESYKDGIFINRFDLTFNPKTVALNNCDIKTGRTDLQANGQLDNLLAYIFNDKVLSGSLSLTSGMLDLNELMGSESSSTTATADTAPMSVLEVPDLIDFTVNAKAKKVIYSDMEMDNFDGLITIASKTLKIKNLGFNMLGGAISMTGSYDSKNIKNPAMDLGLDIKNANIEKTVKTFSTLKKIAPIAEHCKGTFSSTLAFSSLLDEHMNPVLGTLTGSGKLTTGNVSITNLEVLNKLGESLKMNQFKELSLNDVKLSFRFKDGRVNVDPFDVNIEGVKTTISGSNGFDRTIMYTMVMLIPKAMFGDIANSAIAGLVSKVNSITGAAVTIPDPVKVKILIGGTVDKPEIVTDFSEQGGNVIKSLEGQAKAEMEKLKKEMEDKAKAEADRLKKEAEEKAKAESERLKKEAEQRAKAEADRLKKEAEEKAKKEAQDKVKDLFKKPK